MKTYRPYDPEQLFLMPPSLREWLPPKHLAHFVGEVVDGLELDAIIGIYEREERGQPPYHPAMMTKVLLYAYCVGEPSSRVIERGCVEEVALRYLAANNTPDFRTIAKFRRRHLEALRGMFVQVLKLCREAGLVKMGHVALDGTKMKANASKHRAMSYGRMKKTEAELQAEVDELLRRAEEVDQAEDAEYGPDKRGDELPEELATREGRLKLIREAKATLEREAREEAEKKATQSKDKPAATMPAEPKDTAQKNFTDPESRIMPSSSEKGSFVQGYNCQAAVDSKAQIIVAAEVTQQTNDSRQAVAMMKRVKANTGHAPGKASMDAGYFSGDNVEAVEELGTEAFVATGRRKHGEVAPPAPRGRIAKGLSAKELMARKLLTKRGRAVYAKRKAIVEPVFGQIKQGRGFRQFLLRGLAKVRGEWSLICMTHNLLKLWRATGGEIAYATG